MIKTFTRFLAALVVAGGSAVVLTAASSPAMAYCTYSGCSHYHYHYHAQSYHQYNGY